jgi:hypothetical protein
MVSHYINLFTLVVHTFWRRTAVIRYSCVLFVEDLILLLSEALITFEITIIN